MFGASKTQAAEFPGNGGRADVCVFVSGLSHLRQPGFNRTGSAPPGSASTVEVKCST